MRNMLLRLGLATCVAFYFITSCRLASSDGMAPPITDPVLRAERGKYLVATGGCDDCHSPKKMGAHGPEIDTTRRLSGYPENRPLPSYDPTVTRTWALFIDDLTAAVGPWGVTFAANITSDATGIGNWTEQQFIRCLREGKWKGIETARPLLPPMPWQNVGKLTDEDLRCIYAYLKTTRPVRNTAPQPLPVHASVQAPVQAPVTPAGK